MSPPERHAFRGMGGRIPWPPLKKKRCTTRATHLSIFVGTAPVPPFTSPHAPLPNPSLPNHRLAPATAQSPTCTRTALHRTTTHHLARATGSHRLAPARTSGLSGEALDEQARAISGVLQHCLAPRLHRLVTHPAPLPPRASPSRRYAGGATAATS